MSFPSVLPEWPNAHIQFFFIVLYLINTIKILIFFNIKNIEVERVGGFFPPGFNVLPYNSPLLDIWYFSSHWAAG